MPNVDPTGTDAAAELRTAELVRELVAQSERLVREQLRLASVEARTASKRAAAGGVMLGAASAIGLTGMLVLAFDVTYLLAFVLPLWVSSLVVGGAASTVAAVLAYGGYRELRRAMNGSRRVVHDFVESGRWVRKAISEPTSKPHAIA